MAQFGFYIDELVQERRNSSALAVELRLSCTNPSIYPADSGMVIYNQTQQSAVIVHHHWTAFYVY